MEESKFLEAQNLKNEISKLNTILKDFTRVGAKICVSWTERRTELDYRGTTEYYVSSPYNEINIFPEDLQDKVIQLINNELNRLKEEFNNL